MLTEDQAMERFRKHWYTGCGSKGNVTVSTSHARAEPHPAMPWVDRTNIGNCACCGIRWVFDSESKSHKYNHL
jgi:hypothetical protein